MYVSIQPKPKNGLEETAAFSSATAWLSFNPAEAEEWFRRILVQSILTDLNCFNPAEAEEWFRRFLNNE